jgi:hypothetical protein
MHFAYGVGDEEMQKRYPFCTSHANKLLHLLSVGLSLSMHCQKACYIIDYNIKVALPYM